MPAFRKFRFLAMRRTTQVSVMLLFAAGNLLGWRILTGNLSTSKVLGVLTIADPFAVLQILATGHLVSGETLLGASIVVLFFALLAGRSFCSWVCPVNPVTDLANWLREKTGIADSGDRPWTGRKARYWVAGVSLAVSAVTGVAAFEWVSPISMLHRGLVFGMGIGWTLVLAVFLFDLLWIADGFCGHICPLGAFYSLVTGFSLVRVRHSREKCTLCGKCLEICPERQVLPMIGKASAAVTSGECTNCGRCIEVCDDDAMKFGMEGPMGRNRGSVWIAMAIVGILALGVTLAAAGERKQKDRGEEDLGIRKETLYDESKVAPSHGDYGKAEPGKSKRIERAFENSPPLIPHDLTGMLPIAVTNNACLDCHLPENAPPMNATPMPKSHFVDMDTGKDLKGNFDGKRYPCMQCHVPQVNIPEPVKNTFKADFRSRKSKKRSNLLDSLNEGVNSE